MHMPTVRIHFCFCRVKYTYTFSYTQSIRMLAMEVLRIVWKSNNGEARYDAIIGLEDLIFSPKLGAKYFLSRALFCKQAKNKKRNQLSPIQFFYCFCCWILQESNKWVSLVRTKNRNPLAWIANCWHAFRTGQKCCKCYASQAEMPHNSGLPCILDWSRNFWRYVFFVVLLFLCPIHILLLNCFDHLVGKPWVRKKIKSIWPLKVVSDFEHVAGRSDERPRSSFDCSL